MFVKATILLTKETEKPVKIQTSKEILKKIRAVISCCIKHVIPPCYINRTEYRITFLKKPK